MVSFRKWMSRYSTIHLRGCFATPWSFLMPSLPSLSQRLMTGLFLLVVRLKMNDDGSSVLLLAPSDSSDPLCVPALPWNQTTPSSSLSSPQMAPVTIWLPSLSWDWEQHKFDLLFIAVMNSEGWEAGKGGSIGFEPEQLPVFHCFLVQICWIRKLCCSCLSPFSKWYDFIEHKPIKLLQTLELPSWEFNQLELGAPGVLVRRLRISGHGVEGGWTD